MNKKKIPLHILLLFETKKINHFGEILILRYTKQVLKNNCPIYYMPCSTYLLVAYTLHLYLIEWATATVYYSQTSNILNWL